MSYHDWFSALSAEQREAYQALLDAGSCVKCHIEDKPDLFGGKKPKEVLPDDSPLILGDAKPKRAKKEK